VCVKSFLSLVSKPGGSERLNSYGWTNSITRLRLSKRK